MRKFLEESLAHLKVKRIVKLQGEASTRAFYRVLTEKGSRVAMVYPEPNIDEIQRIVAFSKIYKEHRINVPEIVEVIGDRIILQEDLGDLLVQNAFTGGDREQKENILLVTADFLVRLKEIPCSNTAAVLDTARMKWEMDFFISHFTPIYLKNGKNETNRENLRQSLHRLVEQIEPVNTFAHRDFHSRNMLLHRKNGRLYLVDFQDSLVAPPYYDLVSFSFDSYLDHKSRRNRLLGYLKQRGMRIGEHQLFLTALQRNIKALGTFGFQVTVRKNMAYKKYIKRTLRHIVANPLFEQYLKPEMFIPG